ncbi:MAG: PilZ domain-containing protein [Candidatus Tectomicrobia bacterium]|nr:PilZ domain-containing protein [Candidatus Tectomicrobia bacterium]
MTKEANPVGQSQDAEARTNVSRNTMQILLQMKRRLQHHGVTVSLTEPDTLAQVLRASASIEDDELRQCRERLEEKMPNSERVYLFANPHSRLTCQRCQQSFTLQVGKQAGVANPQAVYCPCGSLYLVGLQARQFARKDTTLEGTYLHEQGGEKTGHMIVENISYGGLQMRLSDSHTLAENDKILIQFTLDQPRNGEIIQEAVRVRYVRDHVIGTQFIDSHGLPTALTDYLRS